MQKRETKNSGRLKTSEQEKARTTAKAGHKNFSKKSEKATSRRRQQNEQASGGKKRQRGRHRQAFNLADILPKETIEGLIKFKGGLKSGKRKQNGNRGNNRRHIKRRQRKVEGFGQARREGRRTDENGR